MTVFRRDLEDFLDNYEIEEIDPDALRDAAARTEADQIEQAEADDEERDPDGGIAREAAATARNPHG